MPRMIAVVVALSLSWPPATLAQPAQDTDLEAGVRLVKQGDFEAAIVVLDGVARRLVAERGQPRALARAYAYLAVAYMGLDQVEVARAKVVEALRSDNRLLVTTDEFPPKVVKFFEDVQKSSQAASAATGPPQRETTKKHERSKKGPGLFLAGGAAAAVGLGLAAARSGGTTGNAPSVPTPTPIPTTWTGEVYARRHVLEQSTGMRVSQGQQITFSASGTWLCGGCQGVSQRVGPDGCPGTAPHSGVNPPPLPSANFCALIGAIGGTYFLVGSSRTVGAPNAGELFLGPNDCPSYELWSQCNFDNDYSLRVTVVVR